MSAAASEFETVQRQTPLLSSVPQTPMPPATQRTIRDPRPQNHNAPSTNGASNPDLFTDPMMGAPLSFYIDKDVQDKDRVVQVITNNGGVVSPSYSAVPYILVDPFKESGQALYRQYVGRKGKLVLDARWIYECVKHGQLQTFKANWAGCKLDGTEKVGASPSQDQNSPARRGTRSVPAQTQNQPQPSAALPPTAYVAHPFSYTPAHPAPWHDASGIPPQATHLQHVLPPQSQATRHPNPMWQAQPPHYPPLDGTATGPSDYPDYGRYRPEQDWTQAPAPGQYYPEEFAPYNNSEGGYLDIDDPTVAGAPQPNPTPTVPSTDSGPSQSRGRKRTRSTAHGGPVDPSSLVPAKGPPARSPTPPTRVLKSTYGGNLYTADDVEYLKKYIDYCQDQGLVLSLREICERIAVKAPHHTFYSWRRYCNKHQIRLGSYQMENNDRSPSPGPNAGGDDDAILENGPSGPSSTFPALSQTNPINRDRSPTPPKALTRSTTGKGIAFTNEDVTFLVRFLEYRKSKEADIDMVQFWKDVADRAPHHSRASWMKYWRRHKHELEPDESGQPPPPLPEKKLRYSSGDDILLGRYFATRPQGTSDQVFQAFAKQHPHHPWKGWQEHHRIHKKTVDHYVEMIQTGQPIEPPPPQDE